MRVQPVAHELKLTIWPEKLSETVRNCLARAFKLEQGFGEDMKDADDSRRLCRFKKSWCHLCRAF